MSVENFLKFDKVVADKDITDVLSEEKDDILYYDPFHLLNDTPLLTKAIDKDLANSETIANILKSNFIRMET